MSETNLPDLRVRCSCGLWRIGSHCSCDSLESVIAHTVHRVVVPNDSQWKEEAFKPSSEIH